MSLFTHTYSGIITKGLGLPACCGMITMHFSLFKCTIEVTPPVGISGGGGGPYPPSMIHNPARGTPTRGHINYHTPQQRPTNSRYVYITVKVGETTFKKIYTTDDTQADRIVKMISVINKAKQRISVIVNNIRLIPNKLTKTTPDSDK